MTEGSMKFTKLMVWGAGVIAVAVFTNIWYRHFGSFDWGRFQFGPLLRQVLCPAIGVGAIFGLTAWLAGKQK